MYPPLQFSQLNIVVQGGGDTGGGPSLKYVLYQSQPTNFLVVGTPVILSLPDGVLENN